MTLADSTAALDLEGHELTVSEFYWVTGSGAGMVTNRLRIGEYSARQLAELGISNVEDSSSRGSGKIIVRRGMTMLILR